MDGSDGEIDQGEIGEVLLEVSSIAGEETVGMVEGVGANEEVGKDAAGFGGDGSATAAGMPVEAHACLRPNAIFEGEVDVQASLVGVLPEQSFCHALAGEQFGVNEW